MYLTTVAVGVPAAGSVALVVVVTVDVGPVATAEMEVLEGAVPDVVVTPANAVVVVVRGVVVVVVVVMGGGVAVVEVVAVLRSAIALVAISVTDPAA